MWNLSLIGGPLSKQFQILNVILCHMTSIFNWQISDILPVKIDMLLVCIFPTVQVCFRCNL